jgi:hypothetical protein
LALLVFALGTANAGWHHRHYYYAYPAAYPAAAAYYPLASAYQLPVTPQVNVDEAQLARLLEQSLGAARARGFAAATDNGPSAEMIQVQQDLAGLKAQLNNLDAKVQEHDTQLRSIQEELKALKAQLMK